MFGILQIPRQFTVLMWSLVIVVVMMVCQSRHEELVHRGPEDDFIVSRPQGCSRIGCSSHIKEPPSSISQDNLSVEEMFL
jgi:hypothetical protein